MISKDHSFQNKVVDGIYGPPVRVLLPVTVLLWLAIALFNAGIFIFSFENGEPVYDFFYGFRWTPLYHSPWLLIIPCILYLGRKFPLNKKITFKNLSIHVILALIITSVSSVLHTYFIYLRRDEPIPINSISGNFLFYSVDRLMIYFVILLGYYAIDYYRKQNEESFREVQLQEKINRQKLNSFKNNIQPGFLLNTLKDIENMVPSRPALAEQLVADLARKIRTMLKNSQKNVVSISDDLQFLKSYATILGVRLNRDIEVCESIRENDKDKELAVSLFVISIVEQLLGRDESMFQTLHTLTYEMFETTHDHGIRVTLKRLVPSRPDSEKWLKNGDCNKLARPFSKSLEGQGSAELSCSEDGTLLFSINLPKYKI